MRLSKNQLDILQLINTDRAYLTVSSAFNSSIYLVNEHNWTRIHRATFVSLVDKKLIEPYATGSAMHRSPQIKYDTALEWYEIRYRMTDLGRQVLVETEARYELS